MPLTMSNRRRLRRPSDPAVGLIHRYADRLSGELVDRHEPTSWLRDQLGRLAQGLAVGRVTRCPHLRREPGTVAYFALWVPRLLLCGACAPMTTLTGDA